jgi:serine/threonine protein kinase
MSAEREDPTQLGTNPALGHVGSYALISALGQGGMARVYLARNRLSGVVAALKRPHPDQRHDPAIRGRFLREVEVGRVLQHPGLPRLIEADTTADWPYAVFELVPGLNLEQLRRILAENGRLLPYPVTMSLLCRALEALEAAHGLDVVHRDLSPRNVMLSFDGTVRVIDFGVAKAEVGDFRTRPGTAMGSIRYASPEYFRGEGVGPSADIYGMAAIAYELLSGRSVVGHVENVLQAAQIVAERVPPQIHVLNPEVPTDISECVARGLSKNPSDRPSSAQEFARALTAACPQWCSLSAETIRRFLEAWFPAEAAALQRFLRSTSDNSIEEELIHTVLAPTLLVETPKIVYAPRFDVDAVESVGVRFPLMPTNAEQVAIWVPPDRPAQPQSRVLARWQRPIWIGIGMAAMLCIQIFYSQVSMVQTREVGVGALSSTAETKSPTASPVAHAAVVPIETPPVSPARSAIPLRTPRPMSRPQVSEGVVTPREDRVVADLLARTAALEHQPNPVERDQVIQSATALLPDLEPTARGKAQAALDRARLGALEGLREALSIIGASRRRTADSSR